MTALLSKITGNFDGFWGIFFGPQGIGFVTQSYDLGLTKKYRLGGDGAIAVSVNIPALGSKGDGFREIVDLLHREGVVIFLPQGLLGFLRRPLNR
jgi:hypothetical protein